MKIISENRASIDSFANPYLEGMHTPVRREIDAPELEIIGDVPSDLNGIYLRNGPNPRRQPLGIHHWFDGDGMLHGVQIRDGKISYRNRWVRTRGYEAENQSGKAIWPGVIDRPNRSLEQAWGSDRWLKDTSNTDVVFHNGQAVTTFYQCGDPYLLDPRTLETLGSIDLQGNGARLMSAHNMVDEDSGEMMFFDYATVEPYMTYGVLDAGGRLSHFTPIELPGARLPHTLAITKNFTILMDYPCSGTPNCSNKMPIKSLFIRNCRAGSALSPGMEAVIRSVGSRPTQRTFITSSMPGRKTMKLSWMPANLVIRNPARTIAVATPAPMPT